MIKNFSIESLTTGSKFTTTLLLLLLQLQFLYNDLTRTDISRYL